MDPRIPYLATVVLCTAIQLGLAAHAWPRRADVVWRRLTAVGLTCAAWSALIAGSLLAPLPLARALLGIKFMVLGGSVVAAFLLAAGVTGRLLHLRRWQLAAWLLPSLLSGTLALHDGWGVYQAFVLERVSGLTSVVGVTLGPVFWMASAYHYTLMACCLGFLLVFVGRGGPIAPAQGSALFLGALAPMLANAFLLSGVVPRRYDPHPFALALTCIALWWAAWKLQMGQFVPVARHVLVDALDDGILILDGARRIVDVNHGLASVLGVPPALLVGHSLGQGDLVAPAIEEALVALASSDPGTGRAAAAAPTTLTIADRIYDVRVLRVPNTTARVLVLRDVTARQHWQDEQGQLIARLQQALGEVRTLSGLLPICAGCKKIRDRDGEWQQLETYIRDRTDADFSHGVCPACAAVWMPELQADPER